MSESRSPAGVTRHVTPRPDATGTASVPSRPKGDHIAPPPKSTEPVDEIPRPVPTMGARATLFKYWVMLFKNARPPRLSDKEIASLAAKAEQEEKQQRAAASYECLRSLTDLCPHLVIAFIGVKGAAATTTTMVHVASTIADDTRTLVYGADFNPASGIAGARLGKEAGATVSIQQFAAIVDEVQGDRKSVNKRLRPTRYGVRVLSADDYTQIPGEQYGTTTAKMLHVLDENCDYLLLDTPNDITTPAARAILERADIIVFTANVGERDSLRLLRVSMDTVRELGHPQKVRDSVVVISNTPPGASIDDYKKYLSKTNLHHDVTQPLVAGEFHGQMLTVPHDPTIALNGEVNLSAYLEATLQAYRDVNIAIFEQAIEAQSRIQHNALRRS